MLGRRGFLWLCGATAAGLVLETRPALASVARAVSLRDLVLGSRRALVGTALASESRYERVGGRRRIVTYTRVRVDEHLGGPDDATELMLRTLGGKVGDVGQIVHGEAMLLLNEPALLFLGESSDGTLVVTAMAQGHYPIRKDRAGELRVLPSPRLGELLGEGAAKELVGKKASLAADVVRKAFQHAR